jgi:hypothetical protein
MPRQRLRLRGRPLRFIGRLLVLLLGGALVWYGLMIVLLAVKVAPSTVDALSGYRTAYDFLAGLRPDDIGATARAIIAAAGVLGFLVCGYLALKQLPRPYLARHDLELHSDQRGEVVVEPRATERIAEAAARANTAVTTASGRYGGEQLTVDLSIRSARVLADTLRDVQDRVRRALDEHALPSVRVDVTLVGLDRQHRRELN